MAVSQNDSAQKNCGRNNQHDQFCIFFLETPIFWNPNFEAIATYWNKDGKVAPAFAVFRLSALGVHLSSEDECKASAIQCNLVRKL